MDRKRLIIDDLEKNGWSTRTDICERTKIKWTTAYDILDKLLMKDTVTRSKLSYGPGRPLVIWKMAEIGS